MPLGEAVATLGLGLSGPCHDINKEVGPTEASLIPTGGLVRPTLLALTAPSTTLATTHHRANRPIHTYVGGEPPPAVCKGVLTPWQGPDNPNPNVDTAPPKGTSGPSNKGGGHGVAQHLATRAPSCLAHLPTGTWWWGTGLWGGALCHW